LTEFARNPIWLRDYFAKHSLYGCFTKFDPNSNSFFNNANVYIDSKLEELWNDLRAPFADASDEIVLRNLWALAVFNDEALAILARLGARRRQTRFWKPVVRAIQAELRQRCEKHSWALFLSGIENSFSLIPTGTHTDAFRLRYQLAILCRLDTPSIAILQLWPNYKELSRLAYQRELQRAIKGAKKAGRAWGKISIEEFEQLTLDEKYLVITNQTLFNYFLSGASRREIDVEFIASERNRLRDARKTIRSFITSVRWGYYDKASEGVKGLLIDGIEAELRQQFSEELTRALKAPSAENESTYIPLDAHAASLVRRITGKLKLIDIISMSAADIATAIEGGTVKPNSIPGPLIGRLKTAWSSEDIERLCNAGAFALLNEIPEPCARKHELAWIASGAARKFGVVQDALDRLYDKGHVPKGISTAWSQGSRNQVRLFILDNEELKNSAEVQSLANQAYGTPDARGLADDSSIPALEKLGTYLASGKPVNDRRAFRRSLAARLRAYVVNPSDDRHKALQIAAVSSKKDEDFGVLFAESLPKGCIESLWSENPSPLWLESFIAGRSDGKSLLALVPQATVIGSTSAVAVLRTVEKHPALSVYLNPDRIKGTNFLQTEAGLVVAILCLRGSKSALKELGRSISADKFAEACRQAARARWLKANEGAYLSLLAALGAKWAKVLFAAQSTMHFSSGPGRHLDHVYQRFEIPKNSGGMRSIAAPPVWIKYLQREILDKLLSPLGAHEAAHGFVRGKSIVSNASPHVGKPVVANCDIRNCFPSIAWPLVLAALKRDLAKELTPAGISLVVDLCTFEGALPIGAPTSPALLNRVLLQSDIWISDAAAKRSVTFTRYADDMTFSGGDEVPEMLAIVRRTMGRINLKLDSKKTQIYRTGRRKMVTGLVVNVKPSVPRSIRRKVRAAVHAIQQGRTPTWNGNEDTLSAVVGRTQFIRSVNRSEGERLLKQLKTLTDN
jgi:retron-type reverse transcriptase